MANKKSKTLMEKTLQLLKETNTPIETITQDTKLTFYWLTRFRRNEFKDPGVNKVELLYEYLTGKNLSV